MSITKIKWDSFICVQYQNITTHDLFFHENNNSQCFKGQIKKYINKIDLDRADNLGRSVEDNQTFILFGLMMRSALIDPTSCENYFQHHESRAGYPDIRSGHEGRSKSSVSYIIQRTDADSKMFYLAGKIVGENQNDQKIRYNFGNILKSINLIIVC